jgi:cytoskeletal protein CcmA (bactofilin family)
MLFKRTEELGSGGKKEGEHGWTSGEPAKAHAVAPLPVLRPSLGADTVVSGRLSFTVPTRIDGKLRGEVRASDLLVVGEEGFIEGIVRALKLVVLGEVRGEVQGAESVEVGPGGRLMGTVETYSLVVKEGGCLDGDCRIAPPRSAVQLLRPAPAAHTA